jgi:hypothetical protein
MKAGEFGEVVVGETLPELKHGHWLHELQQRPELLIPPEVIIPHLMWRGGRTGFFGLEKSGKTTLLAHSIACASRGLPFLGEETTPRTIVWCGLEETLGETVRRFTDLGADPARIAIVATLQGNWMDVLSETIEATGADGVVVDTLGCMLAASGITDENQAGEINLKFIPKITQLTREANVGLLLNAHARKSDGRPRGSTALTAGTDVNIVLVNPDQEKQGNNLTTIRELDYQGRSWIGTGRYRVDLKDRDDGSEYYVLAPGEVSRKDQIIEYITRHPDCSKNAITNGVEGGTHPMRNAINELLDSNTIEDVGTKSQSKFRVRQITPSTSNGTAETAHSTATVTVSSTDPVLDLYTLGSDEVAPPEKDVP